MSIRISKAAKLPKLERLWTSLEGKAVAMTHEAYPAVPPGVGQAVLDGLDAARLAVCSRLLGEIPIEPRFEE